jgi:hypothetical protein
MKRIASVKYVMAVPTFFFAVTFITSDNNPAPYGEAYRGPLTPQIKNECLLVAKNCTTESITAPLRVYELRKEIAKGLDVYTSSELKAMEEQLKWIETESGSSSK